MGLVDVLALDERGPEAHIGKQADEARQYCGKGHGAKVRGHQEAREHDREQLIDDARAKALAAQVHHAAHGQGAHAPAAGARLCRSR